MQSQSFEITLAKIATQVWIMVLVPSSFVMFPVILLTYIVVGEAMYYVIFFAFIGFSVFLTFKLIKNCTRRGTLIINEKGLQILFNTKNIFYNHLNNKSIGWDEVNKVAYNYDINHNMPYIVFRFDTVKGSYICMQEKNISEGLDESNWPLWQALDHHVSDYSHVHREHKISRRSFYETLWFKGLMWVFTFFFVGACIYKIMYPADAPAWYSILRLLLFILPAHITYWVGKKIKAGNKPTRVSE